MIQSGKLVSESLATWRSAARACLERRLSPSEVAWDESGAATLIFGDAVAPVSEVGTPLLVPRSFVSLASNIACHRSEARWSLLYDLLWRLTNGEPHLLRVASNPLVVRLTTMHRSVRRASHKMKAFVRFQAVGDSERLEYVAWFEPAHRVVEMTAQFFVDRFRSMRWSILTPDGCARWDLESLQIEPGMERHQAPVGEDALESLWRTYYAGIFNPARLNREAMRAEMPRRYWKNLPEARLIDDLARAAPARMATMIAQTLREPEAMPADIDAVERAPAGAEIVEHSSWDPVHDPGWREARRRAEAAIHRSPAGMLLDGARVVTGVAGWTDPTLLAPGVYYPADATTPEDRLRHYASEFPMVEVDATYYSFPSLQTSRRWVERTPSHFVFNIKAHSLMTGHPTNPARLPQWLKHDLPLRLRVASNVYSHHFSKAALDEVWNRFLSALAPLRESGKLGAIMLQYPRWFVPSRSAAGELQDARERLGHYPATVEVRHRDWLGERIAPRFFALLRELRFTYVAVDAPPGMVSSVPPAMEITNPELAMFRFHGRRESTWETRNDEVAERYRYLYDRSQLDAWVPIIQRAAEQAMTVHLTFNNNKWNYAIANALEMGELLLPPFAQESGQLH